MKLSAWAKANGLAYQTAWRMWRAGKLPIPAEQLPTGTVIVHPPKAPTVESVAIYARGSSTDQKADLESGPLSAALPRFAGSQPTRQSFAATAGGG
jgi:putative resolvase